MFFVPNFFFFLEKEQGENFDDWPDLSQYNHNALNDYEASDAVYLDRA